MLMESIGSVRDCSLVREAQRGSQAAFAKLVHTYDRTVLRLALRLTGSQSDAQDIHQEAFLKVYKKLNDFRFESSFSTWLYRIVTNVCLDHLRRNRARKNSVALEISDEDLLNQLSDDRPGNNPEQQMLDRELGVQIFRALERLTPRERMVFDLRHFQGLKLESVSEILNASEGSIKMTFFRATRKLRLHLGKYTRRQRPSMKRYVDHGGNRLQKARGIVGIPEPRGGTIDRILIIGDNDGLQESLRLVFSMEGYEVDLVPSGLAGLDMLRHQRPSAVILDIEHPGPAECALCREIANVAPGLPLVVLSASSEIAEKVLLLKTGADDFVTIPFIPRELVARIRSLIRRASRIGVAITFALCALSLTHTRASAAVLDDNPSTLAMLQAKADQAQPRDRCFLYARLVSEMTDLAGSEFNSGDSRRALETLALVQRYAEKMHSGVGNDSKKLKEAELLMERTSFRLKNILGEASYEDRQILEETLKQLNQVQVQLMTQVFEK
jgi:RNA polymerase sigma-70 factor, ECF subfamily